MSDTTNVTSSVENDIFCTLGDIISQLTNFLDVIGGIPLNKRLIVLNCVTSIIEALSQTKNLLYSSNLIKVEEPHLIISFGPHSNNIKFVGAPWDDESVVGRNCCPLETINLAQISKKLMSRPLCNGRLIVQPLTDI